MLGTQLDQNDERMYGLLEEVFGYQSFRDGQEDIVRTLVSGKDCLALMPTGAGKSLCYQLAALLLDGVTIVVSPLVSLMQDQVNQLQANGISADTINSAKSRDENISVWRKLQQGQLKLLYISPERLMTPRMMEALQKFPISMIIVDEAHCIAQWGHDFRPEYRDLNRLREIFPAIVIGGFTATADDMTRQEICDQLFPSEPQTFVYGFDRPNILLEVQTKTTPKKQLLTLLSEHGGQQGIIYCLSRKSVEAISEFLQENGYNALPYHAGLDSEIRRVNQERFLAEKDTLIVATTAFGMGIDKPDVRFVFHMDLPGSMEAYYQEIGRAGRDGQPSRAVMLFGFSDIQSRRGMIAQANAPDGKKRVDHQRLDILLSLCEATGCRRQILLRYFGEHSEPCGHCDNCLSPPKTFLANDKAISILKTIDETGQLYGQKHIQDIMLGANTAKIREKEHQHLASYAAAKNWGQVALKSYMRQLFASNYIAVDLMGHGSLTITSAGASVLFDKHDVYFKQDISVLPDHKSKVSSRKAELVEEELDEADLELFYHLKGVRLELARDQGVPAYVIFKDVVLKRMAADRPMNLEDMAAINGVGRRKIEDYGMTFLEAIQDF